MRIAVALHILNYQLLPEFKTCLQNIHQPYDLFITVPDAGHQARHYFPTATILPNHPNKGMDIGGFFAVLPFILKGKYDVVLKLHSKTCKVWRKSMINAICGSPAKVNYCLALLKDPTVGSVTDKGHIYNNHHKWGNNDQHLNDICQTWSVRYCKCTFSGGTMFWMNVSVLRTVFKHFNLASVMATLNTPSSLDAYWYLNHYSDLKNGGLITKEQAIQHWLTFGKAEGRIPNGLAGRLSGRLKAVDGMIEHAYERFFGMMLIGCGMKLVGV